MITRVKPSTWHMADNLSQANILDYGAVADGVTDNLAAINAALATGLPVYIPAGNFATSPVTVPANSVINGFPGLSIITAVIGSALPLLTVGSNTYIGFITLNGNSNNQITAFLHGILLTNAVNTVIEGIVIENTVGDGINITGAATNNINIVNPQIVNFGKSGITVEAGTNVTITIPDISNSASHAVPGDGVSIAPTTAGSLVQGCSVLGGSVVNCAGRGVAFIGNGGNNVINSIVNDCLITNNISHGIHVLTAQQILGQGNIIRSNGADGIRVENSAQYCRFSTNITDTNNGFAIREVAGVSTPNFNGFIYNVAINNTTNTITKLGANSFIL